MKKSLRKYLLVLLSIAVAVLTAIGLTACDETFGKQLDSLIIENAQTIFRVGDEFTYGEGFTVYAHYTDDTKVDVTADAKVTYESGFDMSVEGNYQITVSYGGKKEVYTIYVNMVEPELRKMEIDSSAVKTSYTLGENISFDGISIKLTYETAQGEMIESVKTSIREFSVEIRDKDGKFVEGDALEVFGSYTVTLYATEKIKASYTVVVDKVDLSSVESALSLAVLQKSQVVSGTEEVFKTAKAVENGKVVYKTYKELNYEYSFGDNYTYVKETMDEKNEKHFSIVDDDIFCVTVENGNLVNNGNAVTSTMMDGPKTFLWYSSVTKYGVESALKALYEEAVESQTNGLGNADLKETIDEENREYTFTFTGLVFRSNSSDYYEQTITFKLGENYNIEYAEIEQSYWENDSGYTGGTPSTFTTVNGKTTPNGQFSSSVVITFNQTAGERTEVNPYSPDNFKLASFDFMYEGQPLGDNGTVNTSCASGDKIIKIQIENIMPAGANFDLFPLYFNYEGNTGGFEDTKGLGLNKADEFYAYFTDDTEMTVRFYNGGVYKFMFRCSGLEKTITFNVTGKAPTSMTAQIRNEASKEFINESSKSFGIGNVVYFKGGVNQYANSAQSATITTANSADASLEWVTVDGVGCWKFSATKAGTYKVKITSEVNSSANCTLTFTVNEAPDYASYLVGKYTCTDNMGNIYLVTFTPANEGEQVKGTVVVKMTPTDNNGTPQTNKAQTQNLSYAVNLTTDKIVLTHVSGTKLGVDFIVDVDGKLKLEDAYGYKFVLNAVND